MGETRQKDIQSQVKNASNNSLSKMVNATSNYYIKQSEIILVQVSTNLTDLMNHVTSVRLPEDQINNFANYINIQQGAALKVHTGFIADLSKLTTNLATSL